MANKNVDNKWSWGVCASTFWILFFIHGVVRSLGILFASTVETNGLTREDAAWPFNLCTTLDGFGTFLTGISGQKWVIRHGLQMAVITFFGGFAMSSFTNNISVSILFIGAVSGLSQGYIMGSSLLTICTFFDKYRTIATGVSMCGAAIGGIVLPYIINHLIENYSLSGSYLLVAGISLHALISAMLCRLISIIQHPGVPGGPHPRVQEKKQILKQEMHHENLVSVVKGTDNIFQADPTSLVDNLNPQKLSFTMRFIQSAKKKLSVVKHPMFFTYAVTFAIGNFTIWTWLIIIVDFGKDRGLNQISASFLISVHAISDLFGRLTFGLIVDYGWVERRRALMAVFFAASLNSILMPLFPNNISLYILSATFGFWSGCYAPNRSTIAAAYFGVERMPIASGLLGLLISSVSLWRPFLIGYLRDGTGNYNAMFFTLGGLQFLAGVMWLMEPLCMRLQTR